MRLTFLPLLMKLSGSLFLGLGDAMAAIIGKTYGKTPLFMTGKTLEGCIACMVSLIVSFGTVMLWVGMESSNDTSPTFLGYIEISAHLTLISKYRYQI